jgi:hypothetical protein
MSDESCLLQWTFARADFGGMYSKSLVFGRSTHCQQFFEKAADLAFAVHKVDL